MNTCQLDSLLNEFADRTESVTGLDNFVHRNVIFDFMSRRERMLNIATTTPTGARAWLVSILPPFERLPRELKLCVIAHEVAHAVLGHHRLKHGEHWADEVAESWGFDMPAFYAWQRAHKVRRN